jgi:hypothetical protein
MVLSTHFVLGGVIGLALHSSPATALAVGVASHFLLDTLPHWDYHLASLEGGGSAATKNMRVLSRNFVYDLAKISADVLIGVVGLWLVIRYLDRAATLAVWLGAIGGVLPDALQFAYFKLRWRALFYLQSFHQWIHTSHRLTGWSVVGPLLQAGMVLLVIILTAPWL